MDLEDVLCNPYITPIFSNGTIITLNVTIYDSKPATLRLSENRPNQDLKPTSLYKEMK
jgi:hypothetical protein